MDYVPFLHTMLQYCEWFLKKLVSLPSASDMLLLSSYKRFTTPIKPSSSRNTRPVSMSSACVPTSIKLRLVRTPIVPQCHETTARAARLERGDQVMLGWIGFVVLRGELGFQRDAVSIAATLLQTKGQRGFVHDVT